MILELHLRVVPVDFHRYNAFQNKKALLR